MLALGAAVVGGWFTVSAPHTNQAPNVIVVMTCTTRRDQLSPYGGPAETTPFLARLAASGAQFDDTIASSSWTKESATAIFTGQPAIDAGVADPGLALGRRQIPDASTTLAEHLREAGWWTAGVTANPHLNADFGFAQGMDAYDGTVEAGFQRKNKRDVASVVASVIRLVEARRSEERRRPAYLQITTIDPHFPISVSDDERRRFADPTVPDVVVGYRAMLRRLDDGLADLERRLVPMGIRPDNTLWVVIADHGEGLNLPPHHRSQHGRVLYDSLVRVGWLVRGPGVNPGVRIAGLTSHLDVLPTVLGLVGLPGGAPTDPLAAGFDLSQVVRGDGGGTPRTHAATATFYEGAARGALWTADSACQEDWGSQGIGDDTFVSGCFDRHADPTFTVPTARPALAADLAAWRLAATARGAAHGPAPDAPRVDAVRQQLEALGYAE